MEEFILRIGANASALKSELSRAGAWAKAWATTLAEDLKSKIGRMFAAGFVLDKGLEAAKRTMEAIREKVLSIKRAEGELPGVGSNFIQGVFNYMTRVGLSFEQISKPLLKFKQLIDAAKINPGGAEMRTLERYNIISGEADLKTQKYATSVAKLSDAYLKSGKNLKVLQDLIGKESKDTALLALLELGPEKIEAMNRSNIFTKLTPGNLEFYQSTFHGATSAGQVATSFTGNVLGFLGRSHGAGPILRALDAATHATENWKHPLQTIKEIWGGISNEEEEAAEKVQRSIEQEQTRVGIANKLLELKEKEHELTAQIADQGKATVSEMAAEARRNTGLHEPRLYGMTARMRTALNIDTLEKRAKIAFERGNDPLHDQLMAQAQQMRASNPWLMDKDQNPMRQTEASLEIIKSELKVVSDLAAQVSKDNK